MARILRGSFRDLGNFRIHVGLVGHGHCMHAVDVFGIASAKNPWLLLALCSYLLGGHLLRSTHLSISSRRIPPWQNTSTGVAFASFGAVAILIAKLSRRLMPTDASREVHLPAMYIQDPVCFMHFAEYTISGISQFAPKFTKPNTHVRSATSIRTITQ